MKQGHLALMFLILYMGCFSTLIMEQHKYDRVLREKQRLEEALLDAIEIAGKEFVTVLTASEEEKKRVFSETFLEALQWYLGASEEMTQQNITRFCVPLLILAEEDGVSFCYLQEAWNGEQSEIYHVWSEKESYEFSYGIEEKQKKAAVADYLERKASEYITYHNRIASQYGISYHYFTPDFIQNTSTELHFPMLFIVFQGWPLSASNQVFYENCIDAGAFLQRVY